MNKPTQIRDMLCKALPFLARNPDRLQVYIDAGTIVATTVKSNLSFEYQYKCIVLITDYADHADSIMVPVLAWVYRNQNELMANPDKRKTGITFRADLLNHNTADIEITLSLTERVNVSQTDDGIVVDHLDEPPLNPYEGFEWEVFTESQPEATEDETP